MEVPEANGWSDNGPNSDHGCTWWIGNRKVNIYFYSFVFCGM